jgi:ribonuclease HI
MGPIKDLKGVQRVMGCLAALSRFISRLGERGLPLYRLLRKTERFSWTPEAEEALGNLKALLTSVPILVPPAAGEAFLIYVAATTQVVSAPIVVERREEGHALLVQRPVYFISEVLSETKIRYPQIQKLLYAGAGLLFISPLGKHLRYVLRLHFPASNNVAEYEALVNGLHIAIELGVRRLDAHGDSQLVVDQVMKNSHCRDRKMEAYCDEVQRLEDKFYGLELNHVARWYNETADELAKIASWRTTVPRDVFFRDVHQPSIETDDTPEPEEASVQPGEASAQPEAPSAAEGEALRVEEEQNGVTPNRN